MRPPGPGVMRGRTGNAARQYAGGRMNPIDLLTDDHGRVDHAFAKDDELGGRA